MDLKQLAREAGADIVGIAPARSLSEASFLTQWLRAGCNAAMDFLTRDAAIRQDIRRWYPAAKSVLVCGFGCAGSRSSSPGKGLLARYAAHEDYHGALKLRMEFVLEWLRQRVPGADGRVFADSSPVLERLYGCYAGLGWIGRNCLLVSEEIGSFFLIAGIAMNQDLETDRPVPDRCGSCRLCLRACPSGALGRERRLDARLCTAYLTVEHRGPIPEGRRAGVGLWVAGCDICQEVCPWNGKARKGVLKPLTPLELPLEELALIDEAGFRTRFANTPLSRVKRTALVRNALLAMGNSRERSWRPVLERFREDPDLREQALWSLARLPGRAQS